MFKKEIVITRYALFGKAKHIESTKLVSEKSEYTDRTETRNMKIFLLSTSKYR